RGARASGRAGAQGVSPRTPLGEYLFGAGMYCVNSEVHATDCQFVDNHGARGAGVFDDGDSNPSDYDNCRFEHNVASSEGGGMWLIGSQMTLRTCTFTGNEAGGTGGGFMAVASDPVTLESCEFTGNRSSQIAGGAAAWLSDLTCTDTM